MKTARFSAVSKLLILLIGISLGSVLSWYLLSRSSSMHDAHIGDTESSTEKAAPLYWVAPMDPNFRRDQPGKSPMGMDLVPVYADQSTQVEGEVNISPNIVNNLGVTTAKVSYQALQPRIRAAGVVQYSEDTLIHVHPRVEGWVERLLIKTSGAKVEWQQPLYSLYSPQLVNAQEQYLLALSQGGKSLIKAAQDRLKSLQMPLEAIRQLEQERRVQQNILFKSPQQGVVANLDIREGFYIQPGTTIMSIANLDEVWVEADVFESQKAELIETLPVTVRFESFPNRQWQSRIDYIYPSLNNTLRTVRVRIRLDNPDHLLTPNMIADVVVHLPLRKDQLTIPSRAVIRTANNDRVVKALGNGRFASQSVTIGERIGDYSVVIAGLTADDEVVTSAQFLIDSESNIDSEMERISSSTEIETHDHDQPPSSDFASATVDGMINDILSGAKQLNISRGAIEKWGREPATMNFSVDERFDISPFSVGDQVSFTFEIRDGDFVIVNMHKFNEATQ